MSPFGTLVKKKERLQTDIADNVELYAMLSVLSVGDLRIFIAITL